MPSHGNPKETHRCRVEYCMTRVDAVYISIDGSFYEQPDDASSHQRRSAWPEFSAPPPLARHHPSRISRLHRRKK